jgi:putative ABC transport system permease protein
MNDLKYAIRQLAKRPGFALAVVATLAIGVGANTAIFSAIHAAVLRAPPYPEPDELRVIRPVLTATAEVDTFRFWSYPMFEAFRASEPAVGELAAYTPLPGAYNLETAGEPRRVRTELVSASYFSVLGSPPMLGRAFLPDEDRVPGEPAVTVLSHELWVGQFGADSGVVGRTIRLNTVPLTVVGIARPGFRGLTERADLWVPIMMAPRLTFPRRLQGSLSFWHGVVARVPTETGAALAPSLAAKGRSVAEEIPLAEAFGEVELGFHAEPLADARVNPTVRTALNVLMGAAAFVLLIVCVNVANLLLTQTARRQRELSVRVALGAGPGGIARAMLTESVALGLLGGIGGLLVATWLLDLVQAIAPAAPAGTADPRAAAMGLPVLLFNFSIAAVAGVAVGLLPVMRAARTGAHTVLKDEDQRVSGRAVRGTLVAAEVALALVLLTGAGLMIRTFAHLRSVDPGFEASGLLTATVDLPRQAYGEGEVAPFLDAVRARLAVAPGIEAASVAYCLPPAGGCDHVGLRIEGRQAEGDELPAPVAMNMIDPSYFRTMGIPLVSGRSFDESDRGDAPRVAIVTRAAAAQHWPDENPVGARIQLTVGWDDYAEVVGVVDDVRQYGLNEPAAPMVYLPYAQWAYRSNHLVVRAAQAPLALAGALREAVTAADPSIPVWDVQTMDERVGATLADTRFTTILLGLAAGIATLLAALGVFGVMAFSVAARTREFGVRMALGARRADVVALVLRQGMKAALIGLGVGMAGALALTHVLEGQLHGVSPTDPWTFAAGFALMTLAALVAAYIPARRATRVDPMEALRYE